MRLCLELAEQGFGQVSPNPMVGCVVLNKGEIIGSGYHKAYGGPHAEVEAIQSVKDPATLKGATVYVNLEPCAHYGKTPPCANLLVQCGVGKVIIGSVDPNPLVAGKGIALLQAAGIETRCSVLEKECLELNRRFYTYHGKHRPYVILKWAETSDGYMGNENLKQISGQDAMQLLHRWRSEEDAFMVGTNTLLKDNPQLNNRLWTGKNPVRVAVDFHLKGAAMPLHLYREGPKTIILNGIRESVEGRLHYVKIQNREPAEMLSALYRQGIQSVVVEGGAALLNSFMQAGLCDEIRRFVSLNLKAGSGLRAPQPETEARNTVALSSDYLFMYRL